MKSFALFRRFILLFALLLAEVSAIAQIGSASSNARHSAAYSAEYHRRLANGENVTNWWSTDIGYFQTMSSDFVTQIRQSEDPADYGPDTTTSARMRVKAYTLEGGGISRLASLGPKSLLAVEYYLQMGYWDHFYDELPKADGKVYETSRSSVMLAVPIGLAYKYGSDAIFDRSERFCASIMAGVVPITQSFEKTKFKVMPFLGAEVGFVLGICWKIRGTFAGGNFVYLDETISRVSPAPLETVTHSLRTRFEMKNYFGISLVAMPFSVDWPKNKWY